MPTQNSLGLEDSLLPPTTDNFAGKKYFEEIKEKSLGSLFQEISIDQSLGIITRGCSEASQGQRALVASMSAQFRQWMIQKDHPFYKLTESMKRHFDKDSTVLYSSQYSNFKQDLESVAGFFIIDRGDSIYESRLGFTPKQSAKNYWNIVKQSVEDALIVAWSEAGFNGNGLPKYAEYFNEISDHFYENIQACFVAGNHEANASDGRYYDANILVRYLQAYKKNAPNPKIITLVNSVLKIDVTSTPKKQSTDSLIEISSLEPEVDARPGDREAAEVIAKILVIDSNRSDGSFQQTVTEAFEKCSKYDTSAPIIIHSHHGLGPVSLGFQKNKSDETYYSGINGMHDEKASNAFTKALDDSGLDKSTRLLFVNSHVHRSFPPVKATTKTTGEEKYNVVQMAASAAVCEAGREFSLAEVGHFFDESGSLINRFSLPLRGDDRPEDWLVMYFDEKGELKSVHNKHLLSVFFKGFAKEKIEERIDAFVIKLIEQLYDNIAPFGRELAKNFRSVNRFSAFGANPEPESELAAAPSNSELEPEHGNGGSDSYMSLGQAEIDNASLDRESIFNEQITADELLEKSTMVSFGSGDISKSKYYQVENVMRSAFMLQHFRNIMGMLDIGFQQVEKKSAQSKRIGFLQAALASGNMKKINPVINFLLFLFDYPFWQSFEKLSAADQVAVITPQMMLSASFFAGWVDEAGRQHGYNEAKDYFFVSLALFTVLSQVCKSAAFEGRAERMKFTLGFVSSCLLQLLALTAPFLSYFMTLNNISGSSNFGFLRDSFERRMGQITRSEMQGRSSSRFNDFIYRLLGSSSAIFHNSTAMFLATVSFLFVYGTEFMRNIFSEILPSNNTLSNYSGPANQTIADDSNDDQFIFPLILATVAAIVFVPRGLTNTKHFAPSTAVWKAGAQVNKIKQYVNYGGFGAALILRQLYIGWRFYAYLHSGKYNEDEKIIAAASAVAVFGLQAWLNCKSEKKPHEKESRHCVVPLAEAFSAPILYARDLSNLTVFCHLLGGYVNCLSNSNSSSDLESSLYFAPPFVALCVVLNSSATDDLLKKHGMKRSIVKTISSMMLALADAIFGVGIDAAMSLNFSLWVFGKIFSLSSGYDQNPVVHSGDREHCAFLWKGQEQFGGFLKAFLFTAYVGFMFLICEGIKLGKHGVRVVRNEGVREESASTNNLGSHRKEDWDKEVVVAGISRY